MLPDMDFFLGTTSTVNCFPSIKIYFETFFTSLSKQAAFESEVQRKYKNKNLQNNADSIRNVDLTKQHLWNKHQSPIFMGPHSVNLPLS